MSGSDERVTRPHRVGGLDPRRHDSGSVVVAYDGTPRGDLALQVGVAEAQRRGAPLTVLTIRGGREPDATTRRPRTPGRRIGTALPASTRHVVAASVDDPAVLAAAASARLLVLGRRSVGGAGVFTKGTTSYELARRFDCPLLVCADRDARRGFDPRHLAQVLVGVNTVADVDVVLPLARAEAGSRGRVLTILRAQPHVSAPHDLVLERIWAWLRQDADDADDAGDAPGSPRHLGMSRLVITSGDPALALLGHVRVHDLIVMGTQSAGRLAGEAPDAVERQVLDRMPCDVLIIRSSASVVWSTRPAGLPPEGRSAELASVGLRPDRDHDDGAVRLAQHAMADRTEQQPGEAPATAAPDDEQLGAC